MNDFSLLDIAPQPVKLRIEDYLSLDASGTFDRYAKTELIEGELFYMNARHRPHSRIKTELAFRIRHALETIKSDLSMLIEAGMAIPDHSVPEPDILLTSEPDGEGLVPLASVALIVEIADATVKNDLTRKALLYAEAGVPEYWVVDIPGRRVHQLWSPGVDGYIERKEKAFGERLAAKTLPLAIDIPN